MISMLPLKDENKLKELNEKNGTDSKLAYCLYDGGEITGCCLYGLTDNELAHIDAVDTTDVDMFDGLVRSVMGSLMDININKVIYSDKVNEKFLKYLGFTDGKTKITEDIKAVLFKCKHCQK